jgi:hypothetical protein
VGSEAATPLPENPAGAAAQGGAVATEATCPAADECGKETAIPKKSRAVSEATRSFSRASPRGAVFPNVAICLGCDNKPNSRRDRRPRDPGAKTRRVQKIVLVKKDQEI